MKVDALVLQQVLGVRSAAATAWAAPVQAALDLAQCDTRQRVACFLAQVGHESGCLRYVREIWGPTAQQARYEPGTTLAKRIGNVEPGDGARYMGRGLIQTTGRANYAMTTVLLREHVDEVPDFEAQPQLLELRTWAALSAGLFWRAKRLNRWADAQDFAELTRRINGGFNGIDDRIDYLTRGKAVLGLA